MELIRKAVRPFGRAAHLFFRSQVRLRLRGGVRVELVERDGRRTLTPEEQAARRERAELSAMVGELAQCLDADPDLRPDLRHLSYFETTLRQRGLAALDEVPLDVLEKALDQFEGLVSNWTPRGLASLRSKMSVSVGERRAAEAASDAPVPRPADAPSSV